ncbi:MAG: 3-(methylthio)propionyl-CoA ligase [Stellaceae bacterium]
MRGLMMDYPLLISGLIQYAAEYHGDTEIVTRTVEGPVHRYDYGAAEARAKQVAKALRRLGIEVGDRVATLAWNTHRHFELYYGISGIGAVLHTLNPRLFADQLRYIVNHAEDKILCVDLTFVPLAEKLAGQWPTVRHYIVMTDRAHMPETSLPNALCYEDLVAAENSDLAWSTFDENTASSLCYTSGTTGNPKGSLYSHRSTVLHSMAACSANVIAFAATDSVLPIVPMFHANAWGTPYSAAYAGSKLVFPGPKLDGPSVCELMDAESVTCGLGVPTVWLGCLQYLEQTGKRLDTLKRVLCGGSAVPLSMIETFAERYDVEFLQGWGMTEMSPLGTLSRPKGKHAGLDPHAQHVIRAKQGVPVCLVDCKVVGIDGKIAPHDGKTRGELYVRGPWIVSGYYKDEAATRAALDDDGWFKTGDVAVIDEDGYVQIVDRSKDVIKSGGEWISSIDVENAVMGHPDVAEAAVIGLPHPKWDERPLLIVVPKPGHTPKPAELIDFLSDKLAKWQLPDDVVFVAEIPHGGTGKILKTQLREMFKEHRLPTA